LCQFYIVIKICMYLTTKIKILTWSGVLVAGLDSSLIYRNGKREKMATKINQGTLTQLTYESRIFDFSS
jgi:hypothetical protein